MFMKKTGSIDGVDELNGLCSDDIQFQMYSVWLAIFNVALLNGVNDLFVNGNYSINTNYERPFEDKCWLKKLWHLLLRKPKKKPTEIRFVGFMCLGFGFIFHKIFNSWSRAPFLVVNWFAWLKQPMLVNISFRTP